MTPFSATVRKMFARVFARNNKLGHGSIVTKFRLEELETREVPATFYVSTSGSNSNSGDSANPWRTLQFAADQVGAGDTVIVRAGNYAGFILYTDGTAANRITFTGEPGATVNANNPTTPDGINLEGADYVTIQGFNVTGTGRAGIRAVINTNAIIRNNNCDQNTVWGIFTGFSENITIENNICSRSAQQHGIYVSNSADNPIIRGNVCWSNANSGIHMNGDLATSGGVDGIIENALVENNVLYDNGSAGGSAINCDGVQNSVIRNNLIYNTHATGIALFRIDGGGGSTGNLVINNTVLVASDGRWALAITNGSTNNTIRNNILHSAHSFRGAFSIAADSLSGLVSDYNLTEDRFSTDDGGSALTLAQWRTATGQDSHSFTTSNPGSLFVNAAGGDYHLATTSAALNQGTTTTAPPTDAEGTPRPSGTGVDIGHDELAVATTTTQFQVSVPSTSTAGTSFTVTITAQTSSGGTDSGYRGTIRFTSSDGQATLPANYTFTAADAGVKTFTVTLKTAGSQSVTVTDTATSTVTGTANSTVSAAAASTVAVSVPSTSTAGTAFTLTATARDAFGNVATGYRGTVRFTSTDGQATLPADYTFTAGDAGVKTFSVTLRTAGSRSVTVTDTVTATITGSASSTVSAAAASTVVVSIPSTATAGTSFTLTATARDAFGNTATGYRGTVRFTSSDGQATLPANYTFTAADAGVKTFSITLKTAGSQSVTVTDTATGSINGSANSTVSAAAASTVAVSIPSTSTAGTSFTLTATARDAFGNVATGYRGTVRFTSTDGQATLPANYTFTAGDAGVKTFSVTLRTAGSRSVTVTDTVTASITGTASSTVSAAAATTVLLSAQSSATSGTAFNVTVTARDAFGNTATGYRGTVHFTSTDGLATLPTDYTFTASDNGVKVFSVTLNTGGSQSITVTDTVTATLTATASVAVSAATQFQVSIPSSATAGTSFTVTVSARTSTNTVDTSYRGTIRFTSSDGQATLPADYTFTAADAGVKTFTVTLKTAGAQSVTVTDTASLTGTANSTVSAAAASTVQLSVPSTSTAGTSFTITATARDAFGNVATGYRGTVRFTSTDGQATLPADYTFTAGDAGVKTFSVTLRTAGSRSVTATDTATATITGSGNSTVSAAAASTVAVSIPTNTTSGTAFTVTVTARDAFGNVATGYRGTVRFTSTDGQATLPANYTFTAGDAGMKTFSVTLRTTGAQSVTVTDTGTASINGTASTTVAAPNPGSPPPVVPPTRTRRGAATIGGFVVATDQNGTPIFVTAPIGNYAGGLKSAVGDVNRDGVDDIVVMAGPGALNGLVIIYNGSNFSLINFYFALPGYGGALNLAVGDIDGDGAGDVLVSTATNFDLVLAYSGSSSRLTLAISALSPFFGPFGYRGGVTVSTRDVDGDGRDEIIVQPTPFPVDLIYDGLTGRYVG